LGQFAFPNRHAIEPPPVPDTWRGAAEAPPSLRLIGAGLGLYGVRALPLIDREAERDAIWSALQGANRALCPRAVVLRGAAGHGKSRLAEWMCERADELGAATVLPVFHSPAGGANHGMTQALARHFRVQGMARLDILDRVARALSWLGIDDTEEMRGLTDLLAAEVSPGMASRAANSLDGRHRQLLMRRYLTQLSLERPVLLWIDDGQWGMGALSLVSELLEKAGQVPCRLLAVITVRGEALVERPSEDAALRGLRPDLTARIHRGPADGADHGPSSSSRFTSKARWRARWPNARAIPFAVQLVGDCVPSDAGGGAGICPQAGRGSRGLDSIHAMWSGHIDRLLAEVARRWRWRGARGHRNRDQLAALLGQRWTVAVVSGQQCRWGRHPG
jgi:hypothetical protein